MSETYYKFLLADRIGSYSEVAWLPCGKWMPRIEGELIPCVRGYHLCRESDLVQWCDDELYEAEYRGERIDADDKIVVKKARLIRRVEAWNEKTARLFACDCAEHVLPIYEKEYPNDTRPRNCIDVARKYARGEATQGDLAAARDAAWDAAWDAAGDAAWASARAAARAAAHDAAWAAAQVVVRDDERSWQTKRIMQYLRGEAT